LSLEDEEKVQPFTYAFHTLAVCAGGGHVKRRRVMRLLDIINQPAETHNIGKANDVERTIRSLPLISIAIANGFLISLITSPSSHN